MSYEEFLVYVKDHVLDYMETDGDEEVELHTTYRNNDVKLDGITIRHANQHVSPNLYLREYYQKYQEGEELAELLAQIGKRYQSMKMGFTLPITDITQFSNVQDSIILRLVNREKNERVLADAPYLEYEDLAVTFRWLAGMDAGGMASMLVHNHEFEQWGLDVSALYAIALQNTMRLFAPIIRPLGNVLIEQLKNLSEEKGCTDEQVHQVHDDVVSYMSGDMHRPVIYVLTNEQGLNGATCMLYPEVIAEFANSIGQDLYILPSSIHEVLLVPDTEDIDAKSLLEMVIEVNDTVVFDSEVLSDNIYYFSRNEKAVKRVCQV